MEMPLLTCLLLAATATFYVVEADAEPRALYIPDGYYGPLKRMALKDTEQPAEIASLSKNDGALLPLPFMARHVRSAKKEEPDDEGKTGKKSKKTPQKKKQAKRDNEKRSPVAAAGPQEEGGPPANPPEEKKEKDEEKKSKPPKDKKKKKKKKKPKKNKDEKKGKSTTTSTTSAPEETTTVETKRPQKPTTTKLKRKEWVYYKPGGQNKLIPAEAAPSADEGSSDKPQGDSESLVPMNVNDHKRRHIDEKESKKIPNQEKKRKSRSKPNHPVEDQDLERAESRTTKKKKEFSIFDDEVQQKDKGKWEMELLSGESEDSFAETKISKPVKEEDQKVKKEQTKQKEKTSTPLPAGSASAEVTTNTNSAQSLSSSSSAAPSATTQKPTSNKYSQQTSSKPNSDKVPSTSPASAAELILSDVEQDLAEIDELLQDVEEENRRIIEKSERISEMVKGGTTAAPSTIKKKRRANRSANSNLSEYESRESQTAPRKARSSKKSKKSRTNGKKVAHKGREAGSGLIADDDFGYLQRTTRSLAAGIITTGSNTLELLSHVKRLKEEAQVAHKQEADDLKRAALEERRRNLEVAARLDAHRREQEERTKRLQEEMLEEKKRQEALRELLEAEKAREKLRMEAVKKQRAEEAKLKKEALILEKELRKLRLLQDERKRLLDQRKLQQQTEEERKEAEAEVQRIADRQAALLKEEEEIRSQLLKITDDLESGTQSPYRTPLQLEDVDEEVEEEEAENYSYHDGAGTKK